MTKFMSTLTKTLTHLGFSVRPNEDRWILTRNNVDMEKNLYTETAAWLRASALAGLHDPMSSWMLKDMLKQFDYEMLSMSMFNDETYFVTIRTKDEIIFVSDEQRSLAFAACDAFNKFIKAQNKAYKEPIATIE